MRRDKPHPQTLRSLLAENFTLPAPPTNQSKPIQPETLGTSSSLAAAEPRAGAGRKTTEAKNLFTISKTKANGQRPLAEILK